MLFLLMENMTQSLGIGLVLFITLAGTSLQKLNLPRLF